MSTTTKHADLLNALDEMQRSPVYSLRRGALWQAEQLIARQEQEIDRLKESHDALLAACDQLLHVCEGDQPDESFDWVRAAIAKARGEA